MLKYLLVAIFYFPGAILIESSGWFLADSYYGKQAYLTYKGEGFVCGTSEVAKIYKAHSKEIENDTYFPERSKYERLLQQQHQESKIIFAFGVGLLMLISLLAFITLYVARNRISLIPKLVLIVVSGLLLIEPLQLLQNTLAHIFNIKFICAPTFSLYTYSIFGISSVVAIIIASIIFFKIIERRERLNFIVGSFLGSSVGFLLWMFIVGPMVLP